jgi:hypothetical protein
VLLVLVLLGLLAPPAAAQSDWEPPQQLSRAGAENPQVAIADDGSAVAVWRANDGCKLRLQASYRTRGGNFQQTPEFIQLPATDSCDTEVGEPGTHFRLKMNRRGDAILVFERLESIRQSDGARLTSIRSLYKPAGQKFQLASEQLVKSAGDFGQVEPEVGIDANGNSTVIYHGAPLPFNQNQFNNRSIYQSASRPPGRLGTWTQDGDILSHDRGTETQPITYTETNGSVAVDDAGNRLAVLTTQRFEADGSPGRQSVHSAVKAAGSASWLDRGPDDNAPAPDIAADATEAAINLSASSSVHAWREDRIIARHRNSPRVLNSGPGVPGRPTFGLDASGNALGLWTQGGRLSGAFSPNGGGPAFFEPTDPDPVPGNGPTATPRTKPFLSIGRTDSAATVFEEACGPEPSPSCPEGSESDDQTVRAAIRPPGAKTKFGAPATLSPASDLEVDSGTKIETGPKVALNVNGEGVAVWARVDPDRGGHVVQSALLVPREAPPGFSAPIPRPPPPPPPPPPLPSEIELARPLKRGDAVVLTAKVGGPVTAIQWAFGTKDEPKIVETAGPNGQVPRSVRLRHPNRTFTAVLTAYGPGGARSFKRTFTTLKPPNSPEAQRVLAGLEKSKAAPVFATGDAAGLIGTPSSAARASRRGRSPRAHKSAACSATKVWSGKQKVESCFKPIEKVADIPAREKGAVKALANELKLDEAKPKLMDEATRLTDSYVSEGKAVLNDTFPVTPSQAASIVSMPQAESLISAKAELPVGGGSYDPKNGFNLKLDPKKASIPLGKLPKPPKLPSLAGLEIVGDLDVSLEKQEARIKASVKLPPSIKKAGVQISNQVILRATPERLIVDEVRIGPIDVLVASLRVDKFQIQYKREPNQWDGQGLACLIGTACLDMIPPSGGVTIKNGELAQAGATLFFPQPGIPLFTGVNLERVGFGVGLRPTRIFGNARVGVGKILKLDGRVFIAFPDSQTPFVFDRKDVGNAYPGEFYGRKFTRTTLGASAEAFLALPVVGETKLANAYALYEYPGYAAFGGGFGANLAGVLSINGGVAAEADFERTVFNLHGSVRACIELVEKLCAGAVANVSRGAGGTGGAGACVELGPVNVGGGVLWKPFEILVWPLDGCKWSPFRTVVRSSAVRTAQTEGRYTVTVKEGEPSKAIQLDAAAAAPFIRVSGPDGQRLETDAGSGLATSPGGAIRVMRFENERAKMTVVGLQDAKPGTYTIETLPGSAPIAGVKQAIDPPEAKVTGKVTGKERRRVLTYDLRGRAGQKVTFQEIGSGGVAKAIGSTTRGGSGRMGFTSAPGRGRRKVIAQFELAGMPAERRQVATFTPQSPLLAKPQRVSVRRAKGDRLRVSWRKVPGATRYEVAGSLSSRRMVFATTKRGSATLKGVPRWLSGRVTVRAVDDLRQSKPAGPRFKRTARQPSPFRPLRKCRVAKRKISCGKRSAKRQKVGRRASR